MLTRKDFIKKAEEIGNIVDFAKRQAQVEVYCYEAKSINPRFSRVKFKAWVEKVAQAKSDLKRVQEVVSERKIVDNKMFSKAKGKGAKMHIDDNIKIVRIDENAVDINGERMSTEQALQFLQNLAQEFNAKLYTQDDMDGVQADNNIDSYEQGFENGVDSVYENGNNEKYCCSKCDIELTPEHVERLSNIDKPRLNEFDHCNLVFELSDYNDNCKK